MPVDLAPLKDDLVAILEEQAAALLDGTSGDLRNFVVVVGTDMTRALLLPQERREPVLEELAAQLRAVGEINRLRAEKAAWETFQRIVTVVGRTLLAISPGV